MFVKSALVALSLLSPLALANPDPRPPGPPPPLDYAKLGSLDITPKEALDANAAAVDAVVNQILGPDQPRPVRPDPANMNQGNIIIGGLPSAAVFGDGSLDGDAVFAPVFGGPPAKVTLPSTKCATLPPLFAIYGVLSTYAPLPYIGLSTFTGTPNAASSLSATGAGYAFFAPTNLTNPKTFATSASSLGVPYGGESAIWSLDCATRQLKATWTQSDGSQLPVSFVSWSQDGLVATGNYNAFKSRFTASSPSLTFTYNPLNATSGFWDPIPAVPVIRKLTNNTAIAEIRAKKLREGMFPNAVKLTSTTAPAPPPSDALPSATAVPSALVRPIDRNIAAMRESVRSKAAAAAASASAAAAPVVEALKPGHRRFKH